MSRDFPMPKPGSAADCGSADWWYQRGASPHMYVESDSSSGLVRLRAVDMTAAQRSEYMEAYESARLAGDHKWS